MCPSSLSEAFKSAGFSSTTPPPLFTPLPASGSTPPSKSLPQPTTTSTKSDTAAKPLPPPSTEEPPPSAVADAFQSVISPSFFPMAVPGRGGGNGGCGRSLLFNNIADAIAAAGAGADDRTARLKPVALPPPSRAIPATLPTRAIAILPLS